MSQDQQKAARRARHAAIRAAVATEEAEAAEAEATENAGALDVPLHLRITRDLDSELRRRAAAEDVPTSAFARRLLSQALQDRRNAVLTEADVERIVRRVMAENSGTGIHSDGTNRHLSED